VENLVIMDHSDVVAQQDLAQKSFPAHFTPIKTNEQIIFIEKSKLLCL
jgi:hypothetical protein